MFPKEPCHELNRMEDAPRDDRTIIVFTTLSWATTKDLGPLGCFTAISKNVGPCEAYKGWWPMPDPQ